MSRRVRALCGAVNFWAIIMYNLVSLNSLEFTELVARRLLLTGKGLGWGGGYKMCQPHMRTGTSELPTHTRQPSMAPPPTGFPQTTLAILFVTYCGVQLVKERERTLALEEEEQGKDKEKLE